MIGFYVSVNISTAFLIIRWQVKVGSYLLHFCLWSSHLKNATTAKHSSVYQAKMIDFLYAVKDLSLLVHYTENIPAFEYFPDISVSWFYCCVWSGLALKPVLVNILFSQFKLLLSLSTSTWQKKLRTLVDLCNEIWNISLHCVNLSKHILWTCICQMRFAFPFGCTTWATTNTGAWLDCRHKLVCVRLQGLNIKRLNPVQLVGIFLRHLQPTSC